MGSLDWIKHRLRNEEDKHKQCCEQKTQLAEFSNKKIKKSVIQVHTWRTQQEQTGPWRCGFQTDN